MDLSTLRWDNVRPVAPRTAEAVLEFFTARQRVTVPELGLDDRVVDALVVLARGARIGRATAERLGTSRHWLVTLKADLHAVFGVTLQDLSQLGDERTPAGIRRFLADRKPQLFS